MTDYEISCLLHHIADAIRLADKVLQQHNCNDCEKNRSCEYVPPWGGDVRFNCPLWSGGEEE